MMGLEPTTFAMARRRSSQLSYIRVGPEYSHSPAADAPLRGPSGVRSGTTGGDR